MARGKRKRALKAQADPTIGDFNAFSAQHGTIVIAPLPVTAGEFEGEPAGNKQVRRRLTTIETWFASGMIGFEEPQRKAVVWVQSLWNRAGSNRVTMNWGAVTGGGSDDGASQAQALTELALLKRRFPPLVWDAFENAARWDSLPDDRTSAAFSHAQYSTGFVASMIAMWHGL